MEDEMWWFFMLILGFIRTLQESIDKQIRKGGIGEIQKQITGSSGFLQIET